MLILAIYLEKNYWLGILISVQPFFYLFVFLSSLSPLFSFGMASYRMCGH